MTDWPRIQVWFEWRWRWSRLVAYDVGNEECIVTRKLGPVAVSWTRDET